jgi:hypothetical protein
MESFLVHKDIPEANASVIGQDYYEKIEVGSGLFVSFRRERMTRRAHGDWTFLWYGEYGCEPEFSDYVGLLENNKDTWLWGGRGICLAINHSTRILKILNDCYGAFSVFFSKNTERNWLIASDSISLFDDFEIDWTAFYQFLSFGYIIGHYSIFRDVSRLMANSMLRIQSHCTSVECESMPLKNFWQIEGGATQDKVDSLVDILKYEAIGIERPLLMMSGGWDSRLLLAATKNVDPLLYTHGNLESREAAIVRDISRCLDLDLFEHDFSNDSFDRVLFQDYLNRNESMMFSHWSVAGRLAMERSLVLTAGTFGEVLGGHYGTLNSLPAKKKYLSLFAHMVGGGEVIDRFLHLQEIDQVSEILEISNYNVFWMLREEISDQLRKQHLLEDSNERLHSVLYSYRDQGTGDAQAIYERFYTEHRGGQYINLQLKNSARNGQFRNAFTNRDLVSVLSSINFADRAHNKLNKRIVKKLCPKLLQFPLAATLANAGRPLLVQEISRAARKVIEKGGRAKGVYNVLCRYPNKQFGWNDFSGVVGQEFIGEASQFLTDDCWNKSAIAGVLKKQQSGAFYPYFDMLSKAITLNYWIIGEGGRRPASSGPSQNVYQN